MAFSSMWVGATGMIAHGDRMQVVGNNLANVNTVGYKTGNTHFQDLYYQATGYSGAGEDGTGGTLNQVGKGVAIAGIYTDYRQGGIQATDTSTDLAISGKGFFKLVDPVTETTHYSRAGLFRFDRNGYLMDPHKYVVQGYAVDQDTGKLGDLGDIKLPTEQETDPTGKTVTVVKDDPKATTWVNMVLNLDSQEPDYTSDSEDPFFALAKSWNPNSTSKPIGNYAYAHGMDVYDENGDVHKLTAYFDKADPSVASSGASTGFLDPNPRWEYIVSIDPDEDGRNVSGRNKGLLMMGTMTFNPDGQIIDQSSYTYQPDGTGGTTSSNEPIDLSQWKKSGFNNDGFVQFSTTFLASGSSLSPQYIAMDFGVSSTDKAWEVTSGATAAADVGSNASKLVSVDGFKRDFGSATSNYDLGTATLQNHQDGYGTGYLSSVEVDREGYVNAYFTNKQKDRLFRLNVAVFTNEYGLKREGGNLFAATEAAGTVYDGVATEDGRGSIMSKALEQSNVDMADQFSKMILTQRGFQANSKVISTSDSMLTTAMGLKK